MSTNKKSFSSHSSSTPYAIEPDYSLKSLIGKSVALTDIFTKEKIERCQKIVDDAKASFFDTSAKDMAVISKVTSGEMIKDPKALCTMLFQPVSNIKGQAEAFGFPLITRVCKYLIKYCEKSAGQAKPFSKKDEFIILKLVEALEHAFNNKIMDTGGAIEKELISIIELAGI